MGLSKTKKIKTGQIKSTNQSKIMTVIILKLIAETLKPVICFKAKFCCNYLT